MQIRHFLKSLKVNGSAVQNIVEKKTKTVMVTGTL